MKYLTGYHGTTKIAAEQILKEQKFILSKKNTEWLGIGIYFYPNYSDALEWKDVNEHAILHSVICVNENEVIDLSKTKGKTLLHNCKQILKDTLDDEIIKQLDSIEKKQCYICNFLWQVNPNIKVIIGEFPKEKSIFKTLTDEREYRKEFCVRKPEYINTIDNISLITK